MGLVSERTGPRVFSTSTPRWLHLASRLPWLITTYQENNYDERPVTIINLMSSKLSNQGSASILRGMASSVSTQRRRSFLSQFVMITYVILVLVAHSPCVSSSPTPAPASVQGDSKQIIYDSNAFMLDPNANRAAIPDRASPSVAAAVHRKTFAELPVASSSFRFAQPRTQANQFLVSHAHDNQVIVPKWFTRLSNVADDDDDDDLMDMNDYFPSAMLINKRSSFTNTGGHPPLKKRKQLSKPPMEVMNEIVNSIYLKR